MDDRPAVSVVIPAYNSAGTIRRALDSVRAQTLAPVEIVVVDDASSDDTLSVLEALGDPTLTLIRSERNVGAAGARNLGLQAVSGEFVAFLDADDEWLPKKLELQLERMTANPRCTLVTCDTSAVRLQGEPVRMHERCPPTSGSQAWERLLSENFIPTPTVVARRSDLVDLGGFDPELTIGEDLDLWIRLAERGDVEVISEVLVRTYQRSDSLMRSYPKADAEIVLPMIARHVERLAGRLPPGAPRDILGRRHFQVAYDLYQKGHPHDATGHALKALRLRHRPLRSALLCARAAVAGRRSPER